MFIYSIYSLRNTIYCTLAHMVTEYCNILNDMGPYCSVVSPVKLCKWMRRSNSLWDISCRMRTKSCTHIPPARIPLHINALLDFSASGINCISIYRRAGWISYEPQTEYGTNAIHVSYQTTPHVMNYVIIHVPRFMVFLFFPCC